MAATFTIRVNDKGQTQIEGPLEQPMLCYGMLQTAMFGVWEHQNAKKKPSSKIIQPPPGELPRFPGGNGSS